MAQVAITYDSNVIEFFPFVTYLNQKVVGLKIPKTETGFTKTRICK